jgi:hypothetical protein
MQLSDVKESGFEITHLERDAERIEKRPAPRSSPGPTRCLAPLRSFCRSNLDCYLLRLCKYSSGTGSSWCGNPRVNSWLRLHSVRAEGTPVLRGNKLRGNSGVLTCMPFSVNSVGDRSSVPGA